MPPPVPPATPPVLPDFPTQRANARRHLERGTLTDSYRAQPDAVIALLNEALATEIVCALRYKRHHFTARGLASAAVAGEFLAHAHEEDAHSERFAERITQLGGAPDFCPDTLSERSHAEYGETQDLRTMIEEDLVAERIAIESYREIARTLGDSDPTTRRLFEDVLAVEERHASELVELCGGRCDTRSGAGHDDPTPPSPRARKQTAP